MNCNDIFTSDAINIFTDASIKKLLSGETIGCAGCIIVFGELKNNQIWTEHKIIRDTTNNNSEIKAIKLGLQTALKIANLNNKKVRVFSDSQISIFGLRDRYFRWMCVHGSLIGSEGKPIKNQEVFLEIIHTILNYNLNVNFYHQNGHVNYNDIKSLYKAMHVFSVSNNIREVIELDFIKQISKFNDQVDVLTKKVLKNINQLDSDKHISAICFLTDIDKNKYYKLIK